MFSIKNLRKCSVCYKFSDADVSLGFKVGNIFDLKGDKVISCNTDFKTSLDVDSGVISPESVQGQFYKKYYSNPDHLKSDVIKALEKEDISCPSEIGKVIKLKVTNDENIYLIALTKLNKDGNVDKASFLNIQNSLANLWQYIGRKGEYGHLIIHLIGSGRARINKKRINIAKEIVRSFVAAISEEKICEKLTICISFEDYKHNKIDIDELNDFIKCICFHTKFADNSTQDGTPIKSNVLNRNEENI